MVILCSFLDIRRSFSEASIVIFRGCHQWTFWVTMISGWLAHLLFGADARISGWMYLNLPLHFPAPCSAQEEFSSLPFPERGSIWDELNQSAFAEALQINVFLQCNHVGNMFEYSLATPSIWILNSRLRNVGLETHLFHWRGVLQRQRSFCLSHGPFSSAFKPLICQLSSAVDLLIQS